MTSARVVSIDLAYKRLRDIGVCVLERRGAGLAAEFLALPCDASEAPTPARLADACATLAESRGAQLLLVDGPQAWKDRANGLAHSRSCERALHTPAKTGEPGAVKPRPYTAFVSFSIAVWDALHARGWRRLATARRSARGHAIEVFPHAAWKRLGVTALPAKAKCTPQRLAASERALCERCAIRTNRAPTHDELQALVAGIAGIALLEGEHARYELVGQPPRLVDGAWREGFILAPARGAP